MSYTFRHSHTASGKQHVFQGPGLSQHGSSVHLQQHNNEWAIKCLNDDKDRHDLAADVICHMLDHAYEAGREVARFEIRETLRIMK